MEECFFCGAEGDKKRLFDAIVDDGLVKVCEGCSETEHIPVIKKPTTFQLKESERKGPSFYERAEAERKEIVAGKVKRVEKERQEITLRDLIDRNVKIKLADKKSPPVNLIDNFHWVVMMARRKRKLSQKQLAEEIHESEAAIEMIEKGQLPADDYRLINKLENFLKIRIKIDENFQPATATVREPARILDFDPDAIRELRISDLQKMKKERERWEKDDLIEEVREKMKERGEI